MKHRHIIAIGIGISLSMVAASQGELVSHWNFDADYTDTTGNRHAALVDTATSENALIDTTVKQFGAGSFAMGDSQDCAAITTLTLTSDADGYTVSLWLKRSGTGIASDGIALGINGTGGTSDFIWWNASSTSTNISFKAGGTTTMVLGAATLSTDWHHLVLVDEGTGNGRTVYVDNVATTGAGNTNFTFDSLGSGYDKWGLVGNLDEVWVFDTALTATEVGNLFAHNAITGSGLDYATWATANADGDGPELDSDGDGMPNAVEFLLGETGTSFTPNPALAGGTITWPKDPAANATWVVETSTNMQNEVTPGDGGWTTATTGVTDNGSSIEFTPPTGSAKLFIRLRVTIP